MCILFLAINQHPDYPLIVAANRDEFFSRPSLSMHYWEDRQGILAGRDELQGGSWLGVNQKGEFCAVTNFRTGNAMRTGARSRGELVTRFLAREDSTESFTEYLNRECKQYSPFNVVYGIPSQVEVFCSQDQSHKVLNTGYHSLSNGYIDQHWPKMSSGVQQLMDLIDQKGSVQTESLNRIMRDQTKANDDELPDTGIEKSVEKHISSIFISGDEYGTRTTTYLFYGKRHIDIQEINYNNQAEAVEENTFQVDL